MHAVPGGGGGGGCLIFSSCVGSGPSPKISGISSTPCAGWSEPLMVATLLEISCSGLIVKRLAKALTRKNVDIASRL